MHDRPAPRRHVRRFVVIATAAVLVVATTLGIRFRHQIVAYSTHLKGSPTQTAPYAPFPADDPPDLRIAVAGDVGDSGSRLQATGNAMDRIEEIGRPFDDVLLLGDNVYPSGDPSQLPSTVFEPLAGVLDGDTELLAVVGNHDRPHEDEQLAALGMPGRWWSIERSGVLIVGLDSNHPDDPDQLQWLEETLRDSSARWKIVALHHPPYSAGYQGSSRAVRDAFVPIFERYGVQLVLAGHDHDYQRSVAINGVTYIVSGAASGTRRTGDDSFTAVSFSWHSFVELAVWPDRLEGRVLNQDARIADQWTLR